MRKTARISSVHNNLEYMINTLKDSVKENWNPFKRKFCNLISTILCQRKSRKFYYLLHSIHVIFVCKDRGKFVRRRLNGRTFGQ